MVLSGLLLTVWFASSVCSTLVNKGLMDRFPYAVTLSAVHLLSSVLVDLCIVWYRGLRIHFRRDVFLSCMPVAATINAGKLMTYVSYGLVPASLTHTAKASSPVFSVLVSKVLFNQVPSRMTFLSLIPITVGVTLSALTEINWVFSGFLAAVAAALANVLNSTYTKKALHPHPHPIGVPAPDPLVFHMYTASAAVAMLLPYALLVELPNITLFQSASDTAAAAGALATQTVSFQSIVPLPAPTTLHSIPVGSSSLAAASVAVTHVFPWSSMLLSLVLHYLQNISNIYFLSGVSVLTHQVAQSLKRLVNIAGAVLYFGNRVTPMNVVGMGLALLGFSMYSAAKQLPGRPRSASTAFLTHTRTTSPMAQQGPTGGAFAHSPHGLTSVHVHQVEVAGGGGSGGAGHDSDADTSSNATTTTTTKTASPHLHGLAHPPTTHGQQKQPSLELQQWSGRDGHHAAARMQVGSHGALAHHDHHPLLHGGGDSTTSLSALQSDDDSAHPSPEATRLDSLSLHPTAHAHSLLHAQALAGAQMMQGQNLDAMTPHAHAQMQREDSFCV